MWRNLGVGRYRQAFWQLGSYLNVAWPELVDRCWRGGGGGEQGAGEGGDWLQPALGPVLVLGREEEMAKLETNMYRYGGGKW